jgi:hypothetical protein
LIQNFISGHRLPIGLPWRQEILDGRSGWDFSILI